MTKLVNRVDELGEYLREQRVGARLSVRELAKVAGVSNPYLSQIERGLRKPSAEVLQQLANGLRISAEVLYVRAGILDSEGRPDVEAAVAADPALTERQRRVLLDIYESFVAENARTDLADAAVVGPSAATLAARTAHLDAMETPEPARSPARPRAASKGVKKSVKKSVAKATGRSATAGPATSRQRKSSASESGEPRESARSAAKRATKRVTRTSAKKAAATKTAVTAKAVGKSTAKKTASRTARADGADAQGQ